MPVSFVALLVAPSALLSHSIAAWRREPETRIEDAYKWLFHATMGGEHAVTDPEGPRLWMEREWKSLGAPRKAEPMVVRLSPDGKVLRVNLRPYRAAGGDQDNLLWMFILSAERFKADNASFVAAWSELGRALAKGPIGKISVKEWRRLDRATRPGHYPAIHHSDAYERAYAPAYRVVINELWAPPPGR